MIERTFQNIPEGQIGEADQQSFLVGLGWSRGTAWEGLLRSKRVLIISEAGAGKTHECRVQARRLWDAGEPAFFVELTSLATEELRSLLEDEEEARLDAWLSSQTDVATFFLDSIDELRLSRASFEQALKRVKKAIGGRLGQARIVVTTRPIPFDERALRRLLPVPPPPSDEPREEAFARIVMGDRQAQRVKGEKDEADDDWRTVGLMPLSEEQIVEFAGDRGVEDPVSLLDDLKKRNALEFARRPQDLIELCADWPEHKRIRTHRAQVATAVRVKLQPREDRREPAELSVDKAIEGASRLALAMMVTRRMTIRHSAESDDIEEEAALDPSIILPGWRASERKALLERALFGFASYGRVRFHHRSVVEYLAAERLRVLRERNMTFGALKRLLFAETRGKMIVRPSMRPVAGWLALDEHRVFEMLRDNDPAVLLDQGDPGSLSPLQRDQALRAYVKRYGQGGWRGLSVPRVQVHRFASAELSDTVKELWAGGIESPDVREFLLHLMEAGRFGECAEIAHGVARDGGASISERMIAVDAMVAITDPRLTDIATEVASADSMWPDEIARGIVLRLFPRDLSVEQLCRSLKWIKDGERITGRLGRRLSHVIANSELDPPRLDALRDGLVALVSDGLSWQDDWQHFVCRRPYLDGPLAATCLRGLDMSRSDDWLHASVLALRLNDREYRDGEEHKALHERLTSLGADETARLFWAEDSLIQSLPAISDPWRRFAEIALHDGPVELRAERDLGWIKEALGDTTRSKEDRAMLLEAAMRLPPDPEQWREHVSGLKPLVSDLPHLLAVIDQRLKPSKLEKEVRRWEKKRSRRKKQEERRNAEWRAGWIQFWRDIADRPEIAFSPDRGLNTAWDLLRAMKQAGEESRESEWNRRFMEEQFGRETADRLRRTLMNVWREDRPTLPSERPEDERRKYFSRWQLGLAGLYAEAEDPSWAKKLTEEEAELAARYASTELNGMPLWVESLVDAHPKAVDSILGKELSWDLTVDVSAHGRSMLLQDIHYASERVARLFLPRLRGWLDHNGDSVGDVEDRAGPVERLRQVVDVLLTHGGKDARKFLIAVARRRLRDDLPEELILVWLRALIRLIPDDGVAELERRIRTIEPGPRSEAVTWFGVLFRDRHDVMDLKIAAFTPSLLLRLLRLAYRHVRRVDDAQHEGAYSPDIRDHAEHARNAIENALLDAKGEAGWTAKLEMANDPLCSHFKDRILVVAEERWAQEIDSVALDETQAVALDKTGEAPASTNEAMFVLMVDRLEELDELLLSDTSPRDLWAGINDEKTLRREIARELRNAARGIYRVDYKVDQESVTAEEKETDIRLRSVVSEHEAVIELKRTDHRSARELCDTIQDQLVTKYMAPESRRSGSLLVTLARDRWWKHPGNGTRMGAPELKSLLRDEARRVEEANGGTISLHVHFLDLRPRLSLEKKANRN